MNKIALPFLLFLLSLVFFAGCKKDKKDDPLPDPCAAGMGIGNLNATVSGNPWCANSTLFADYAVVMTISGMNKNTSSMTLELDDVTPGTYEIREDRNHILYTNAGQGWHSTDDNPGVLVISTNDEANNRIKGTFNLTARNPIGSSISISGNFDVFYTE